MELPNDLSDLINRVIKYGRSLDREENMPNSAVWYEKIRMNSGKDVCVFCTAGTVMAFDEDVMANEGGYCGPGAYYKYDTDTTNKLFAIDRIRTGNYVEALRFINERPIENLDEVISIGRPDFEMFKDWEQFDQHLDSLEIVSNKLRTLGY